MTTEQITRIERKIEKIDELLNRMAVSMSAVEERVKHVPMKSDMLLAIKSHWDQCSAKRSSRNRWLLGFLIGLPTVVITVAEILRSI